VTARSLYAGRRRRWHKRPAKPSTLNAAMDVSMPALLAAHRALNVDHGFIPRMTLAERRRMVEVASASPAGLPDAMTFCAALKKNAYLCEPLGEPKTDPVNGRDLAAAVFRDTQPKADGRAKFCAWQLMNLKKHADKLYIAEDAAEAQLRSWDAEDAMQLLVQHPKRPRAVTTKELHVKQAAINRLWREARVTARAGFGGLGGLSGLDGLGGLDGLDGLGGLDAAQREGVLKILRTPASLLTGMGGVGKSACVGSMIRALRSAGREVVCLAPTHKAKYNIASCAPDDVTVTTIQSYTMTLKRAERMPALFVIVDESSMLDIDALGDFAVAMIDRVESWQLCLVGDEHQLQPVGRGECFRLAVRQAKGSVVRLTHCYRAAFAKMFDFHCAVRSGTLPRGDGGVVRVRTVKSDMQVMEEADAIAALEGAKMTYIAWRNVDVERINKSVQQAETGTPPPGVQFNEGDAVIYVGENKPGDQLTNAATGTVVSCQRFTAVVEWDVQPRKCTSTSVRDLRLAYCLTVHKAQGSGFDRVCVVCTASASMLGALDRRWLYTAVSRARKEVLVLCTAAAHELAAKEPAPAPLSCLSFRPASA
jgi:hypothetical protein